MNLQHHHHDGLVQRASSHLPDRADLLAHFGLQERRSAVESTLMTLGVLGTGVLLGFVAARFLGSRSAGAVGRARFHPPESHDRSFSEARASSSPAS